MAISRFQINRMIPQELIGMRAFEGIIDSILIREWPKVKDTKRPIITIWANQLEDLCCGLKLNKAMITELVEIYFWCRWHVNFTGNKSTSESFFEFSLPEENNGD